MALTQLTKPRTRWATFKLKVAKAVSRSLYDKIIESGISVMDFGAVGDGVVDDTIACQTACTLGKNVIFPEGYTFKCNVSVEGGGRKIYLTGATIIPADTSIPTFALSNLSWNYTEIIGGTVQGSLSSDRVGVGFHFGEQLSGRFWFKGTMCRFFDIALHKEHGNIGTKLDSVTLTHNNIAFLGIDEQGMHSGCDLWAGGYVASNSYGVVYFNELMDGFGQVTLDSIVTEKNGINFILQTDSYSGLFGSFRLTNVWNEAATLSPSLDLVIPRYANKKNFDSTGKFIAPIRSAIVEANAEISGLGLWQNQPYISKRSKVISCSILDRLNVTEAALYDIDAADINLNMIEVGTNRVDRVTRVQVSTNRGFSLELPFTSSKQKTKTFSTQAICTTKWTNPLIPMTETDVMYDAVYDSGAFTFNGSFAQDSYKCIPDVPSDVNDVLVHGLTITLKSKLQEGAVMTAYLRQDGMHVFGSDPRVVIKLDNLEVGIPHRFVIACGSDKTKERGFWWQASGINSEVHIQDSYQFTCTKEEVADLYNSRFIPHIVK